METACMLGIFGAYADFCGYVGDTISPRPVPEYVFDEAIEFVNHCSEKGYILEGNAETVRENFRNLASLTREFLAFVELTNIVDNCKKIHAAISSIQEIELELNQ